MKKLVSMMFVLYLMTSATAQTEATGTVTDDATQARLRVNYCVFGGPYIDIYLNGEVAVVNGHAQTNMPPLATWGYWHLEPGTYSVAVAPDPTLGGFDRTFMPPVDVTLEFLRGFSGVGYEQDGHEFSFDTFLRAVETTGLTEMLETSSPYVVFPPTDEAFATLPEDEFNALMADPEALADLVRYHVVEGYYPRGGLTGEEGHVRVLTNLLGMELELLANPFNINGTIVSDLQSYMVANGSRVVPITAVLTPPEQ